MAQNKESALRQRLRRTRGRWGPASLAVVVAADAFVPVDGRPIPYVHAELGITPMTGFLLSVVMATASSTAVLLLPRRRLPAVVVGMVAWVLLSAWVMLGIGSYVAARTARRPAHLAWYVLGAGAAAVLPTVTGAATGVPGIGREDLLASLGGAVLFVGLPVTLGLWSKARREVIEGLQERAAQLEREQAVRAEQARLAERARIARDMHDVVAHRVTLMVLHAGALEVNAKDEKTTDAAELIRTTGREALAQLRDAIGILKRPGDDDGPGLGPQPTLVDLDRLLDRSRAAGIPVARRDEGTPQRLPTLLEHAAYRVIQEALTNVHKHAGAVSTDVAVRYHTKELEIMVNNAAPQGPVEPLPGSGTGLVGLRERVELLDGEFVAEPRHDGGFTVSARFPLSQPALEEHA
ncbi:histidine kinase [Streptomyces sp. MST-110588]|uniref:sensor histidine kinase n=1 Tax=Streptomyces sp. MST-110588 TaxID=2833628 RepID=UPI001F5CBE88|nr:histidine kinase [Streptomyces sp. MST-110588]UNO43307.1 sensor histidine kinase [Streptomyces sp. MST-110588]